ncbi:hypothetical protein F2Q68_00017872 [Brassica cretica]|uniref:DUF547 domain-containing protein n=1 Tax=Brassica cretica TaxID=69181 RepID=A0A8S9H8T5_BRACR|nr:hypothetical protein F2Q68_00017872 [Brassica cretica]
MCRVLKEKLSKVDLSFLNHKKKMTFWINTYNACVMNGFLEHGLPSSKEKLLTILKMATIDVGGTQLSALDIEGSILHSPCEPLEALSTDVHKRYGFRCVEPNLMFVLCRGDWSSPALRVYTAEDVVNELIKARSEYLEASIGISGRKKIVIPRFLHKRLRDFADDEGTLVEWICRQLPQGQRCLQLKETAMEWLKKQSESSLNKLIEMVMKNNKMTDYENNLYKNLKSGKLEVRVSYRTFLCPYCPKQKVGLYIDILQHASGVGNSSSKKRSLTEKACHRALAKYLRKDLADYATATVSRRSKALASLTGDIPLAYDDQFEKLVWPWKGILVNIPTKMGHDGLCCTGESGPQLKDELIRRGFNPIRVRTVWDCFGHSGTGIVEFNRDWNGLNDALLFKKAYQEDGHGKKDWLSGGAAATDSSLYAWLANADDYYRANYIGEYLRKMGDLKSISRFAEEEARKDHKLVQRLNVISENIQNQLRMLEEKFSKTSIALKCETEEKDKILHGYNQDLTGRQQRSTDHFNRIFADHEKQKAQLESQMKELQIRESVLAKRDAENETQRKIVAKELEQSAAKYSYVQLVALEQQKTREKVKKMAVDHKV